jgi:FADH2 O2-dependent halogenase
MSADTDIAIVGSGFGGSLMAMIARRLGYRVTLLERGRHPRFAIGESASPLAGVLIEQLSDRYDLPRLRPLSAFGTWQRTYPHVVCGLKRGFTYFKHEEGRRYRTADDRANQLLVAASPSDELSDTHWLRSDVDHFLVNEALALGTDYQDLVELDAIEWQPSGDPILAGTRQGRRVRLHARFVIDASGPRGFLSKTLRVENRGFDGYPPTQALFSHFTDVARCEDMEEYGHEVRGVACPNVPYPMDDAALHHVFDGGWMWVLRFGNGVTSAGVAVEDWLAERLNLAEGEPAWHRLLARFPSVRAQFADARPIRSFTWMPRLAYRAAEVAGERWAMLPSAAAFIDPLFSTGIPLTLLGIERLARLIEDGWQQAGLKTRLYARSGRKDEANRNDEADRNGKAGHSGGSLDPPTYAAATLEDADRTARFIAGSYAGFRQFLTFTAYSMFYFTAASFSEMARRLDSPRAPRGFLCGDSPAFVSALQALSPLLRTAVHDSLPDTMKCYEDEVAAAVARWNIAGLCDSRKRNWYPVDLNDTIKGADKLGLTPEVVRAGLEPTVSSAPSAPV